jgi:hypothetical protein
VFKKKNMKTGLKRDKESSDKDPNEKDTIGQLKAKRIVVIAP